MLQPELLSPAGDMERLTMALHYGADAVYLAGKEYGLRAAAGNFDDAELAEALSLCHAAGVKAYITVNVIPHEGRLAALPGFLERCEAFGADGLIIADLGVFSLARRYAPKLPIHISTQLGVVNSETARMLYELGAKRVVLAREMRLSEIAALRANTPPELELEAFVHGAMCVSFSGRCLLSNYMTGRDGNGGVCAQPCRWKYHLMEEQRPGQFFEITEDREGAYILNSRDLCMIEHLAALRDVGVCSFKIEGRMKSAYYAAAVTNAYRHALDDLNAGRPFDPFWRSECDKVSHRPYSTGFYFGEPGQHYPEGSYFYDAEIVAVVEECDERGEALLTERNRFSLGDRVELLNRQGKPIPFSVEDLRDGEGQPLDTARHPMMPLRMRLPVRAEKRSILRKLRENS